MPDGFYYNHYETGCIILMYFLTFQFMVQLSIKGFLSKFNSCGFSYQTPSKFPYFVCGMVGHSKYGRC